MNQLNFAVAAEPLYFASSSGRASMESSPAAFPSFSKAVDGYRKAVTTVASVAAYAVLARGMARELFPDDLRDAASWDVSLIRGRLQPRPAERRTLVVRRFVDDRHHLNTGSSALYDDVREYLATRIDPRAMRRLCLSAAAGGYTRVLSMEHGSAMTDVFEGVEFTWASVAEEGQHGMGTAEESLEPSFDAEQTDMALGSYVPFVTATAEEARRRRPLAQHPHEREPDVARHHPPPPGHVRRARHGPRAQAVRRRRPRPLPEAEGVLPADRQGVEARVPSLRPARHRQVQPRRRHEGQRLLITMSNKCILVIEDIDCCFSATSREDGNEHASDRRVADVALGQVRRQNITLSGLLNFIDGLWSMAGEERIIIFTTNYRERLDKALLRPGRMGMHIYMGYCCWEAFKTLARNYHLVDDHELFPEIQELLSVVEVTPAEVSEMMLLRRYIMFKYHMRNIEPMQEILLHRTVHEGGRAGVQIRIGCQPARSCM
ncbi:hypothetical protein ACP4OV_029592 [Aristida adscensionis]